MQVSLDLVKAERRLSDQRKLVSKLRKQLRATQGHRETKLLMGLQKMQIEKISRLQAKTARISARISQMQPTGWKEFLQVVKSHFQHRWCIFIISSVLGGNVLSLSHSL
jgi:hypothetical protein